MPKFSECQHTLISRINYNICSLKIDFNLFQPCIHVATHIVSPLPWTVYRRDRAQCRWHTLVARLPSFRLDPRPPVCSLAVSASQPPLAYPGGARHARKNEPKNLISRQRTVISTIDLSINWNVINPMSSLNVMPGWGPKEQLIHFLLIIYLMLSMLCEDEVRKSNQFIFYWVSI